MDLFLEKGRRAAEIVEHSGADFGAMTVDELGEIANSLKAAVLTLGAILAERCRGSDRAKLEIRRAINLPPSVLIRRDAEAKKVLALDGMPSIPQHAAVIARMISTVQDIEATIERAREQ